MRKYVCDICKRVIDDPYAMKMKEFLYVCSYDEHGVFPMKIKNTVKTHLCNKCYAAIGAAVNKEENENG